MTSNDQHRPATAGVALRPMTAADQDEVDRILRLSFGTEFRLPDPMAFRGDGGLVAGRFAMFPDGCFVAEIAGRLIGCGVANRWGSVGFLGPVCVHPEFWGHGLARLLIEPCLKAIDRWGCTASGLFTDGSSPRHLRLYQEFGFWPRQLTIVMSRPCSAGSDDLQGYQNLSDTPEAVDHIVGLAADATNRLYPGLDLGVELRSVLALGHGDVVYRRHDDQLDFALCHFGPGSEGSSQALLVKFAQVGRGADSPTRFDALLAACMARARREGVSKLVAGVNTRQHAAYRQMIAAGFRGEMHGIRMHRPYLEVLDAPDFFGLMDWR